MFKDFNRHQPSMLTPNFHEVISPDDLVYLIAEVTDRLEIGSLIRRYDTLGQNAYNPHMMLGLLFFAYTQKVFSSRQIAERVCYDMRFMFLCGRLRPDFRTISDFRKNHIDLLKGYFTQIVRICRTLGMAPLREVAIDGTKIKASASPQRTLKGDALAEELAIGEAEIAMWLSLAEQTDASEDQSLGNQLLKGLPVKTLAELQALVKAAAEKLTESSGIAKVNLTDPESRDMKGVGPGYNAQIAVDADDQLIVGANVTDAGNDSGQLLPMIEELEMTTATEGKSKLVAADSGYASAEAFQGLTELPHIDAYVPTQRQVNKARDGVNQFDKEHFELDPQTGTGLCPLGQPMRLLRTGVNKSGQAYHHYIGTACAGCPLRTECTRAAYRSVVVLDNEPLLAAMEAKTSSPSGRKAGRMRRCTVEPVFGVLKEQLGFRRFSLRGLAKAQGEFALLCIAFNLKKLHRWRIRRLTAVLAYFRRSDSLIYGFIRLSVAF
jgi:transposase